METFFVVFSYFSFVLLVGTCGFITYQILKSGLGLGDKGE